VGDLKAEEAIGSIIAGFLVAVPVSLFTIGIFLVCGVDLLRTIGMGLIALVASGVATMGCILFYFAKQVVAAEKRDCDG
jgi:hypothetical protein